ncbi:MAG: hypothetical protein K0V04_00675 [Deltaproteobacteria bacterium]|nr:hypothetical protein [Deltaproteobacteria bacterium]
MASFKSLVPIVSSLALLLGCAVDSTDSDLGVRSADYVVTQADDQGGLYVQEVGESLTECADGSLQSTCYVEATDLSAVELSSEQEEALDEHWNAGHVIMSGALVDDGAAVLVADPVAHEMASDLTTPRVEQAGWPIPTAAGEQCGSVTCGVKLECCNASCGWCVPPDMSCIQFACGSDS